MGGNHLFKKLNLRERNEVGGFQGGRHPPVSQLNTQQPITRESINNEYQLLLWASIINRRYSNYTIIMTMNNLGGKIGLEALRLQEREIGGGLI